MFFSVMVSTTLIIRHEVVEHVVCGFLVSCTIYLELLSFVPLFGFIRWTLK